MSVAVPSGRTAARDRARVTGIASFPAVLAMNPYQRLLYDHLRDEGFELVPESRFTLRWLTDARSRVGVLHLHWPEGLYTFQRGPAALRPLGSRAKLVLFAARLAYARALGYRIAWTVHQVYPHGSPGRGVDRLGALVLARAAHVLIVHDETTRAHVTTALGPGAAARLAIVPHGSYVGVYPPGRSRAEIRRELDLDDAAFVFLCFGELRAHKSWRLVVRAFRATAPSGTALVLAGMVRSAAMRDAILSETAGDPRIRLLLRFVDDAEVAELFGAADAAVVPRDDGGTSGSLLLPLSLGVPVVVADRPTYRDVAGNGDAGWLFTPGDERSLRTALERAAADPREARRRGAAALQCTLRLRWPDVAARTAGLLRGAGA